MRRHGDWDKIGDVVHTMECVATHAQLKELGVSASTITRRIGVRGPWRRLLPGVVLAHRGTPTRRELLLGALAFAGQGAIISGLDALRAHGLRNLPKGVTVHVLIPERRHRKSFGFVKVERTRRPPTVHNLQNLPYAGVARAVVDACRHVESLDGVRELIAEVVQNRRCTIEELRTEILRAARQRTALSREVLKEVSDGIRSVSEAKARATLAECGVKAPLWNVALINTSGETILTPDGYWPEIAGALEIDSLAWHFRPGDYTRTKRRERQLVTNGIVVLAFTPREILDDPEGFAHEVRQFLRVNAGRALPEGITVSRSRAA